jgi:hypothetical protein
MRFVLPLCPRRSAAGGGGDGAGGHGRAGRGGWARGAAVRAAVHVYQLIKANYVDQTDDDKLVKGAIDGMLASLDPHSSYLDGASLDRLRTMIDGGYAGLGLSVVQDDGAVKVISPMRAARRKRRASRRATISPISTASSSWRRSGRCRGKDARRAGHAASS